GSVDEKVPGDYSILYSATDSAGHTSSKTRLIHVVDTAAPIPMLAELPPITGQCSAGIAAAPKANDACAGQITGTTNEALSYTAQGTYTVHWTYDDGNGNTSTQEQAVI